MFSYIRRHFGTAGLIVAIVALFAALAGGAYAATGGLSGKQKKEVKAIAKSFQGTGPAGPAGSPGAKGDPGKDGSPGTPGKDGTSATTATFAGVKGACNEGGVEVKSASPTVLVCNGEAGVTGFTATLPPGETETGTWGGGSFAKDEEATLPISLNIPLESAPDAVFVHPGEDAAAEGCPGVVDGLPTADEGKLCVYAGTFSGAFEEEFFLDPAAQLAPGTAPNGTILAFKCIADQCFTFGTWAATAPE